MSKIVNFLMTADFQWEFNYDYLREFLPEDAIDELLVYDEN